MKRKRNLPAVSVLCALFALGGCPVSEWDDGAGDDSASEHGPSAGALTITSTVPDSGATAVSRDISMEIHFSGSVNPESLAGYIRPQIDLDITWSHNQTRLLLAPVAPLEPDTTYALTVESVVGTNGDRLAQPVSICFSTGSTLGDCPAAVACQPPDATDPHVPAYTAYNHSRPFAERSVWNTRIEANPEIDPASSTLIARMIDVASQNGLWLGFDQYTPPVYFADARTAVLDVTITSSWAPVQQWPDVPIPHYALPGCGDDNFMIVIDVVNNRAFDFWQATPTDDGSWSASWMAEYALDSPGTGVGIRAAQFPLAAGLIWPHELDAGHIDHALVFGYSFVRSGILTAPASATDGAFDDPAALPMGARVQLDPTLDLDTLGLTPHERAIARALQEYGMILGDSAGSIALTLVHPYSFAGNPYEGLLPDSVAIEGGTLLERIPVDHFRVLRMNVQAAP
jgi:hypothetical protein